MVSYGCQRGWSPHHNHGGERHRLEKKGVRATLVVTAILPWIKVVALVVLVVLGVLRDEQRCVVLLANVEVVVVQLEELHAALRCGCQRNRRHALMLCIDRLEPHDGRRHVHVLVASVNNACRLSCRALQPLRPVFLLLVQTVPLDGAAVINNELWEEMVDVSAVHIGKVDASWDVDDEGADPRR